MGAFLLGGYIAAAQTATRYVTATGLSSMVATEANVQVRIPIAGIVRNLFVHCAAGTTCTCTSRKGGSPGNLAPVITDSTEGNFLDSTNVDSVAVGDLYNYQTTNGTSSTWYFVTTEFAAQSGQTGIYAGSLSTVGGGNTGYAIVGGGANAAYATETQAECTISIAGIRSNLSTHVSTNTLSGNCTITSRLNEGAGGMSFVIASGSGAGIFTDGGSGSDSVSAGDRVCTQIVAVGTGAFLSQYMSSMISATSGVASDIFIAGNNLSRSASATVNYCAPINVVDLTNFTAESTRRQVIPTFPCSISNFRVKAFTNTYTGSCTVTLRKNSADAIVLTIPTTSTAEVIDNSSVVSFNGTTDYYSLSVTGGTSGSIVLQYVAFSMNDDTMLGQACM